MRLRLVLLVLLTCVAFRPAAAQDAEAEVIAVIERLFDGMRAGDSTAVRSVFARDARLLTTGVRDGVPIVQGGPVDPFVTAIGTPHDEVWDERILGYDVRVDAGLASVWTPYQFYAGETFSHCGVNAIQLARTAEGWKILQIVDTRRTDDCPGVTEDR